jgi:DNA-binding PadR family transcriptional regulator
MRDPELEILAALDAIPSHVYGLKFRLEERDLHKSHSDLYKMINSLERKGLVSYVREPSEIGPERKVYSITDAGREALFDARKSGIAMIIDDYYRFIATTFQELMVAEFESERPLSRIALFTDPFRGEHAALFAAATADLTDEIHERWLVNQKGKAAEGFIPVAARQERLPFRDQAFDLVIAPALAGAELAAALPEIARVLAPGAQLVTFLPLTREMTDTSLLGGFLLREIAAFFPEMRIWRQVDFLRLLDAHFDVMSVNYLEFSLIFCRPKSAAP